METTLQSSEKTYQPVETVADHPWKKSVERLLAQPLFSAMNAGWATQQDVSFVAPILIQVHKELVDAGIRSLQSGGNRTSCSTFQISSHSDGQISVILDRLGISRELQSAHVLPSCAKFFVDRVTNLYTGCPAQAYRSFVNMTLQMSALSFAALEKGLAGAAASVASKLASHESDLRLCGNGPEGDAVDTFLDLQLEFLSDLFDLMRLNRLDGPIDRIQARRSLERTEEPPIALFPGVGEIMFAEEDEKRSIQFTVERYPCTAEVLDPRVVRIPPGKYNNRHKHAHETLFLFFAGTGEILVGETWVKVKGGDAVFCPRWAIHQTHNTGPDEMVLLAVTDYYLTSQVYVGKYDKI
ncbi:cupin domain-containing protein [uncultured Bradyrhizobium sp.]|uniref:cupin domain-containing protein n=1 Tax=uncultured Bradyrhizobium sp. TaxID=199684 RepID=UPI0035CABCC9